MRRRDLERLLAAVPEHPSPRPEWEQYQTPAAIAADLLWAAREDGDVQGRVLDLGCGTGVLSIGAALLGADEVLGVDVDPAAIDVAQEAADRLAPGKEVRFRQADLRQDAVPAADLVVMNPPFGAQKANRGGDRVFYERAAQALRAGAKDRRTGAAWFLAPAPSARFVAAFTREVGGALEQVLTWDYPLPARFGFHADEVRTITVHGYRWAL